MIQVTAIRQPDAGWPVAYRCTACRTTVFMLVPWAAKPTYGDYLTITDLVCPNQVHAHNVRFMTSTEGASIA